MYTVVHYGYTGGKRAYMVIEHGTCLTMVLGVPFGLLTIWGRFAWKSCFGHSWSNRLQAMVPGGGHCARYAFYYVCGVTIQDSSSTVLKLCYGDCLLHLITWEPFSLRGHHIVLHAILVLFYCWIGYIRHLVQQRHDCVILVD